MVAPAASSKVAGDAQFMLDPTQTATARSAATRVFATADDGAPARTVTMPPGAANPATFVVTGSLNGWVHVWMPWLGPRALGDGATQGWVHADDISLGRHNYRLTIDTAKREVRLTKAGKAVASWPASVAPTCSLTGRGDLVTTLSVEPPAASPYGSRALVLDALTDPLPDFAGGSGPVVLHGTTDPATVGGPAAVTGGCVRLRNADIDALARQIPLGVPVDVR